MSTLTLEIHQAADCLPDVDTDVLVWEEGQQESQLGALFSNDPLEWVDAQGESLRVVAWAEMPVLPKRTEPSDMLTITGQRVDLAAPWGLPA